MTRQTAPHQRPHRARPPRPSPSGIRPSDTPRGTTLIYGFHPVLAALQAKRRPLHTLFATEAAAQRLAPDIATAPVALKVVTAEALAQRLGPQAVHQGVLLEAGPVATVALDAVEFTTGVVLVLDQITDPHNVGAILRTAAAFAVDAVVTTDRHMPDLGGIVAKASSGGVDHVPVVSVVNLARALDELGDRGVWRVGLDSAGEEPLDATALPRPLALVLGSEGKGLRRLTRERCDAVARLDMPGPIKSLNVSNACAVALTLVRHNPAR